MFFPLVVFFSLFEPQKTLASGRRGLVSAANPDFDGQGTACCYFSSVFLYKLPRLVSEPQNFRAGCSETCIIVDCIFEGYGSTVTHVMYVASFNGFCVALMFLRILVRGLVGHATSMALHSCSH